jgi:hypothetical protein
VSSNPTVLAVVIATFGGGILLDTRGPEWGQAAVNVWVWAVLLWVMLGSDSRHRLELAVCVVLATLGELFLMEVWGLYAYRLGSLPLFVPPGHALLFSVAVHLGRISPAWLPWMVAGLASPYVGYAAWAGFDTQSALWLGLLLGNLWWGRDTRMYGVAFVFALALEVWGTSLGAWRWVAIEPWFGLTTTNPPVGIGAVYCTLEVLVRATSRAIRGPLARVGVGPNRVPGILRRRGRIPIASNES